MAIEIESTLVVSSHDPQGVLGRIASLKAFGAYRLEPGAPLHLYDRYFDTAEGDLHRQSVALRLRNTGEGFSVCLKGRERFDRQGAVHRLEIEEPWTRQGLEVLAAGLARCGLAGTYTGAFASDPRQVLEGLRLQVIQERGTLRQVRQVYRQDSSGAALAEMALDTVSYRPLGRELRHHEVEIEGRAGGDCSALHELTGLLLKAFAGELRAWPHNKLVTGLALEELLGGGLLPGLSAQTGCIAPEWYDLIAACCKERRRP